MKILLVAVISCIGCVSMGPPVETVKLCGPNLCGYGLLSGDYVYTASHLVSLGESVDIKTEHGLKPLGTVIGYTDHPYIAIVGIPDVSGDDVAICTAEVGDTLFFYDQDDHHVKGQILRADDLFYYVDAEGRPGDSGSVVISDGCAVGLVDGVTSGDLRVSRLDVANVD